MKQKKILQVFTTVIFFQITYNFHMKFQFKFRFEIIFSNCSSVQSFFSCQSITLLVLNLTTASHTPFTPILSVSSPPTTTSHTMVGQNMLVSTPTVTQSRDQQQQQQQQQQLMSPSFLSNYPGLNIPAAYLQQSARAPVQSQSK